MTAPEVTVHHNPGDRDGRVWMLAHRDGQVWRLTDTEARELSAGLLSNLAYARATEMRHRDQRAVPFAEWAADQEQRQAETVF